MEQQTQNLPSFQLAQPLDRKLLAPNQPNQQEPATPAQKPPLPTQQQQQSQPGADYLQEEDFFKQFSGKKQATQNGTAASAEIEPGGDPLPPTPEIFAPDPGGINVSKEKPPMDEAEAYKQARTFMEIRQQAQAFGFTLWGDGKWGVSKEYFYDKESFENLVEAYAPLAQQLNVRIPSGLKILTAELFATGPLVALAKKNADYRKRMEIAEKRANNAEAELKKIVNARKDNKTSWKIGNNGAGVYGYFTNTPAGTYIANDKRTERPELTDENIKLLIKHNGKAAIDKLLKK